MSTARAPTSVVSHDAIKDVNPPRAAPTSAARAVMTDEFMQLLAPSPLSG
jgi:hypothetical protein